MASNKRLTPPGGSNKDSSAAKRPRLDDSDKDGATDELLSHLNVKRWQEKCTSTASFRHVEPYVFEHKCFVKRRWLGKTILEAFSHEFDSHDEAYFRMAISCGAIKVNAKPVSCDYKLRDNDSIVHTLHRHEPRVTATPIKLVYASQSLCVVNKPAGLQVHPAGPFHYNTLLSLLVVEKGMNWLNPLHRLDRLTSGLILLGPPSGMSVFRSTSDFDAHKLDDPTCATISVAFSAKQILDDITAGRVEKLYLAKVRGHFVVGDETGHRFVRTFTPQSTAPKVAAGERGDMVPSNTAVKLKWVDRAGANWLHVDVDIVEVDPKNARQGTAVDGCGTAKSKPSSTLFKLKSYDAVTDTSIVECMPESGRTHQIRVHLACLGYPIANDPVYNHTAYEELQSLDKAAAPHPATSTTDTSTDPIIRCCVTCTRGIEAEFNVLQRLAHGIYLHSLSYAGLSADGSSRTWWFTTPLPDWAITGEGETASLS